MLGGAGYYYDTLDFSLPGLPEAQHDFAMVLLAEGDRAQALGYLTASADAGFGPASEALSQLF